MTASKCPSVTVLTYGKGGKPNTVEAEPICDFISELRRRDSRAFYDLRNGEIGLCRGYLSHESCFRTHSEATRRGTPDYIRDMVRMERSGPCLYLSKFGIESKSRKASHLLESVEAMSKRGLIDESQCLRATLYEPHDPEKDELVDAPLPKFKAILRERAGRE